MVAQLALPPTPALPPLKLPAGYYRDVFINAVYASLSTLSLSALSSPFSTPLLPVSLQTCRLSLPFFCLSPSSAPSIYFSPFSLCRNLITSSYNFHRRRGLICKSHRSELTPTLAKCPNRLRENSFPVWVFPEPRGFCLCLPLGSKLFFFHDK